MKKFTLSLCLFAAATLAQAQVTVRDAWVRGVFVQLSAEQATRLVAAKSPVAGVVELHEMVMDGDVMKMRQIPGLDIVPGRVLELKPGGFHVMLIDIKGKLRSGDVMPITLVFEDTKTKKTFAQEVKAPVTALGGGNMPMKH